ncbi:glutaredoxin family protein [Glaciecola sp. 1036]|uniref:glutaredoxin family protein n=1 Tax=Alteromonadaceae TaxID=72275 RepID=UPI003D04143F
MQLTFFTGPQCSLCDDAEELLKNVSSPVQYKKVNIREHVDFYHLYAVRIPVLKRDDNGAELGWPFDLDELNRFLA